MHAQMTALFEMSESSSRSESEAASDGAGHDTKGQEEVRVHLITAALTAAATAAVRTSDFLVPRPREDIPWMLSCFIISGGRGEWGRDLSLSLSLAALSRSSSSAASASTSRALNQAGCARRGVHWV